MVKVLSPYKDFMLEIPVLSSLETHVEHVSCFSEVLLKFKNRYYCYLFSQLIKCVLLDECTISAHFQWYKLCFQ